LSLLMMLLSFLTFFSWVIYALSQQPPDWYIAISNILGTLFVGVILLQFIIYNRKKKDG